MKNLFTIVFISLSIIYACQEKQPNSQKQTNDVDNNMKITNSSISPFWKTMCESGYFSKLFDCDTSDCYQIELFNDPFKDYIVLTVNIKDSLSDEICYNRFSFKTVINKENYLNKSRIMIPMVNSITNDTVFCFFVADNKIKIKKDNSLNYFLKKSIWEMPKEDKEISELDVETWTIKARTGKREIILHRHEFKDSMYYTNIQNILNIFNIKDYRYSKR